MTTDDQRTDEAYLLAHDATQAQADAWRDRHPWGRSSDVELDAFLGQQAPDD